MREAEAERIPFAEVVRRRLLAYDTGELLRLQSLLVETLQTKVESLETKIDLLLDYANRAAR